MITRRAKHHASGGSVAEREWDAALYQAVTQNLPDTAVTVFDDQLRVRMAYGEALSLNGWTSDEVEGKTPRELLPAPQADVLEPLFRAALSGKRSSVEVPSVHGDRLLLTYVAPVLHSSPPAGVAISVDITERKDAEEAKRRLAAIVEQSHDAIAATTLEGEITEWNQGAEDLYGYSAADMIGRTQSSLIPPDRRDEEVVIMSRVRAGETVEHECPRLRKDHTQLEVSVTASPIRDASGRIVGTSAITRDISERKRLQHQLLDLAKRDPLTGLLNRRAFDAELSRSVALVKRLRIPAALLMLDVDHFKDINDTYGHATGDATLRRVAGLLEDRVRETDVVARLGGDEFALILPGTDADRARALAADLLAAVRSNKLVVTGGPAIALSATVGVAPIEPQNQLSTDELLAQADIAMYEAKEAGRDRVAQSDLDCTAESEFATRLSWGQRIVDALDRDRFVLYEQPIVNLATGVAEHAELLLRMRNDDDELVLPSAFLPAAERLGNIVAIDQWVVEQAIVLLEARQRAGRHEMLHVNLSGTTVGAAELLDALPSLVAQARIDHAQLAFEINETAAIGELGRAQTLTRRLSALGCSIVLDDFGSGFASFHYLKHLPFDSLKIDGEFVRHLTTRAVDRLTVGAIVDMAHGLGKTTIAESVEDEPTLDVLRELGVRYAQGFHLGRPAPQQLEPA